MNFKIFVETNIMLMIHAWMTSSKQGHFCLFECWLPLFIWQTFVDLNFYVFSKPTMSSISLQSCGCLLRINVFQNRDISLCLNIDCLCLFHKLSQTWNSKLWWKEYHISLQWGWCLLRNDVIKIGKFIFVWTLIVSI